MPDLATIHLHFRGDSEKPSPRKFDDLLKPEGCEDLYDFVRIVALEKHGDAGPEILRDAPEGGDAQVVRMLVGDPDVRHPRKVLLGEDGLRMQGPALVEDVSPEPGVGEEMDRPGAHQGRGMADERDLHGKAHAVSVFSDLPIHPQIPHSASTGNRPHDLFNSFTGFAVDISE